MVGEIRDAAHHDESHDVSHDVSHDAGASPARAEPAP